MPSLLTGLGRTSRERLETVHPDLRGIVEEVAEAFPLIVICGHRGQEEQELAFREKKSTKRWPHSNHNQLPSVAVDIAPLVVGPAGRGVIIWKDAFAFGALAGFMMLTAKRRGIAIRWGADWDGDWNTTEHQLIDGPHFELVE